MLMETWKENKFLFIQQLLYPDKPLHSFHRTMLDYEGIESGGRRIQGVLAPRGSWKTGIGTIGDATWEVCDDPNIPIQIFAESQGTSVKFLSEIKQHLQYNKELRYFYGEHVPKTGWRTTEFTSAQCTVIQKEPTIEVFGVGGRVVGRRARRQYMDDLVSLTNSRTDHTRAQIADWYSTVAKPILNPGGVQKIRGTRYFARDLYYSLLDMYGKDVFCIIPAIWMDEEGIERSYWPQRFPLKDLLEERKHNPISFSLQYMNDTSLLLSAIILPGVLRILKESYWPDPSECIGYIGVDPARKTAGRGSWFAVVSGMQSKRTGMIYIRRVVTKKLATPEAMMKLISGEYRFMREMGCVVRTINIESNAFQGILVSEYRHNAQKYGVMPVIGSNTIPDKETAFIAQAKYFNSELVYFHPECFRLLEDVAAFPDCKIADQVDAMVRMFEAIDKGGYSALALPVNVTGAAMMQTGVLGLGSWDE